MGYGLAGIRKERLIDHVDERFMLGKELGFSERRHNWRSRVFRFK